MAKNNRLTKEEIREDKFIDGILRAYLFFKANLLVIIVAAVVVSVAIGAYAIYHHSQETGRAQSAIALRQATETYREAEKSLLDAEKLAEGEELLKTAQAQLKAVFEGHPNTTFADKARYQYAKTLYDQENYAEARVQFQKVIETHQPESQLETLYAQKAIGNTYEQQRDYEKAIAAYQAKAFPPTPQLAPTIRKYVLAQAKFNQALIYEKMGDPNTARDMYKEIVDEFRNALQAQLMKKSRQLLEDAKHVAALIDEPLDTANVKTLEAQGSYYEAYVVYTDLIHTYKVNKDIEGKLSSALRNQIRRFEKRAAMVINNVRKAQRLQADGREGTALYSYDPVLDLDTLGISRQLYEHALFHYKRLETAG